MRVLLIIALCCVFTVHSAPRRGHQNWLQVNEKETKKPLPANIQKRLQTLSAKVRALADEGYDREVLEAVLNAGITIPKCPETDVAKKNFEMAVNTFISHRIAKADKDEAASNDHKSNLTLVNQSDKPSIQASAASAASAASVASTTVKKIVHHTTTEVVQTAGHASVHSTASSQPQSREFSANVKTVDTAEKPDSSVRIRQAVKVAGSVPSNSDRAKVELNASSSKDSDHQASSTDSTLILTSSTSIKGAKKSLGNDAGGKQSNQQRRTRSKTTRTDLIQSQRPPNSQPGFEYPSVFTGVTYNPIFPVIF